MVPVGAVRNGTLSGELRNDVPPDTGHRTIVVWIKHRGMFHRHLDGITVNGQVPTAIVATPYAILHAFGVRAGPRQGVAIDLLRDDRWRLHRNQFVRYVGTSAAPALPDHPLFVRSTWGGLQQAVPAVWHNQAWELPLVAIKGSHLFVRFEDANGDELIGGTYINGLLCTTLHDLDATSHYDPIYDVRVAADGRYENP